MSNTKQLDRIFRKGVQHHLAGRLGEASKAYQQILARVPEHPPSLHLLGVVALQIGQAQVAADLISTAVAGDPNAAAYRNDLGEALRVLNRLDEAAVEFGAAIRLDPAHTGALSNLGLVRYSQGRLDDAIKLYRRALDLAPHELAATLNLGVAYLDQGDVPAALSTLQSAARLAPNDPAVSLSLGNALLAADDLQGAEETYRHGLLYTPDSAPLQTSLGRALRAQGRVSEALGHDRQARSLAPDLAEARWNEGLDNLLLGDYAAGWEGFAWRWQAGAVPPHGLATPEWQGESLAGKHLLIHAEQGLGDTLQFIRFLPDLARFLPREVTLLCQPALVPLLSSSGFDAAARIIGPELPLPEHEVRIALLDLPLKLGVTLADLPRQTHYIRPSAERIAYWRDRLPTGKRRIGVVWKGRADHANDRNRSMPLDVFQPLLTLPGVSWVSLQKETTEEERAALGRLKVRDIGSELIDLVEAAAAIEMLDLVVAVDTALAHLAGAMGKTVWVQLPFAPDWRWMLMRSDTPWYPSARVFRQSRPGDWTGLVEQVRASLAAGGG